MSLALCIVSEKPELQERIFVNGKAIGQLYDHVGVIAVDNGLKHIEQFIVPEADDDSLIGFGAIEYEIKAAKKKLSKIWFGPIMGLEYFQKLSELIRKAYNTTSAMKAGLAPGIQEYIEALELLVAENSRWRLRWDY